MAEAASLATPHDAALERSTLSRLNWRLIPLVLVLYVIAMIDRTNVGFAALQMNEDLGFSSTVFGFGAGASRPIIRGLEGPRVKILQNGMSVSDLSSLSNDHAVAAEASTARQIEILRGPAALLYGSGAIGGLVNIVNERIPTELPPHPAGEAEVRVPAAAEGDVATGPRAQVGDPIAGGGGAEDRIDLALPVRQPDLQVEEESRLLVGAHREGSDAGDARQLLGGGPNCPVREQFNVRAVPTLVLVDDNGWILWRHEGRPDRIAQEDLDLLIKRKLGVH